MSATNYHSNALVNTFHYALRPRLTFVCCVIEVDRELNCQWTLISICSCGDFTFVGGEYIMLASVRLRLQCSASARLCATFGGGNLLAHRFFSVVCVEATHVRTCATGVNKFIVDNFIHGFKRECYARFMVLLTVLGLFAGHTTHINRHTGP